LENTVLYLGVQYTFAKTTVTPNFENKYPDLFPDTDMSSKVASFGLFADWDKLDNFFTPNKGFRLNTMYAMDDSWTGSDYEYQKLSGFLTAFFAIKKNWISGIRLDAQHVIDQPPFYLLPFINMRGLPIARYQGYTTALVETEQRIDFNKRWSAVVFGGLGKAMNRDQSFSDADLVYSYGTGFRYLIARAFGVRAGIDVAAGPDSFGWYIVFGHNWAR
jgi:outer membrane translocation and assembly module TamA